MIATMEQQPQTRRERLLELLAWLERLPRAEIRIRVYCPDHPDTKMVTRNTEGRQGRQYCPIEGCCQSWKGNPTRET